MSKKFEINIRTIFSKAGINRLISGLDKGIKRSKAFGAALRKGMHSAPVRLLRNALAALVGTLAAGVMQAAKFNIQMARAWTMSSQGISGFRAMRNEVRELSGELALAKDQLASGLYQALSAGVPEDNVFSFLKTAAKIAVADGSDVEVAVDGMTTILNAFKIEASETEAVADQLFNTVANGKTSFGQLAPVLATAAPLAAATGVAFEEMLAAVATLTKQGTPTAQAMTQIRSAITATTKVLGDGWAKTMSLQEAFKLVDEQAGGSQKALLKLVGSIEAVNGVMGLTGQNAQMAAADLAATADAAGSVERAFQKVDQFRHWQKLWQNISGLVERTAQEADSRLAPAILRVTEAITEMQANDLLWDGLTESLDKAEEQLVGIFEYINSEGWSGAADVMEALGQILIGHAKNGAQDAMALIAKWAPVLGMEFGKAAVSVIKNSEADEKEGERRASQKLFGKDAPSAASKAAWGLDPEYRKESRRQKEIVRRERIDKSGRKASDAVGSGSGDANIEEGLSQWNQKWQVGQADAFGRREMKEKEAWVAQEIINLRDSKKAQEAADQAIAFGQRHSALGQAKPFYRQQQQQERDAATAGAPNRSGPTADAARESLERERAETAEVSALIRAVQAGDNALIQAMLTALQTVVQNQNSQSARIEQVASQVKNGRS